jgi:HAD superfamily phosphoserine phosphatase-like hydrolase
VSGDRAVFVDYDGTITDLDTFEALVRESAGDQFDAFDRRLHDGSMTLRDVLAHQASLVHVSIDEADALLRERTRFDPSFAQFVAQCEAEGIPLTVLSSGVLPLIERAFARNGLGHVTILANEIDPLPTGWRFRFRDDSDNGHDKAAAVRAARDAGMHTVFIGDGPSDFAAAIAAHERYAKLGRALEVHLRERGIPFTPFTHFSEILPAVRCAS